MPVGKRITIGLIALPLAELVAFVLMTMAVGLTAAFALIILTSLAGALVLRRVGRAGIGRFRAALADQTIAAGPLNGDGLVLALGGILLVLPGFITGLAGALLLLPWTRRRFSATIRRATSASRHRPRGAGVVDLAPDEWRRLPDGQRPPAPGPVDRR